MNDGMEHDQADRETRLPQALPGPAWRDDHHLTFSARPESMLEVRFGSIESLELDSGDFLRVVEWE